MPQQPGQKKMADAGIHFFDVNPLGIIPVLAGKKIIFIIDPEIFVTVDRSEGFRIIDGLGTQRSRNLKE